MALDAIGAETLTESSERILGSESGTTKGFSERTAKRFQFLEMFLARENAGVAELSHQQEANCVNWPCPGSLHGDVFVPHPVGSLFKGVIRISAQGSAKIECARMAIDKEDRRNEEVARGKARVGEVG